jgi:hypothetical protein
MQHLVIGDINVRRDEHGLFSLNDLHHAAGGDKKDQPYEFLRSKQGVDLIELLQYRENPGILKKQGLGTFVSKELVYAYAMWISAKFHLQVIRAYDELMMGSSTYAGRQQSLNGPGIDIAKAEKTANVIERVIGLAKQAASEADAFVRQQLLHSLQHLCLASGIEYANPELIGKRLINDHPIVERFWDAFESMNNWHTQPFNHSHSCKTELAINLTQIYEQCQERGINLPERRELISLLEDSGRYPYLFNAPIRSRLWKKTVRCLVFKRA